jgi:translation initiation factor IF-2
MAKIRVYQLAKELSVENAELIDKLKSLGFEVKNHMSTLSEGEVDRVRSEYTKTEEVKVDEIRIKPGIIRRRKKAAEVPEVVEAVEEAPAEPVPEAEVAAAPSVAASGKEAETVAVPVGESERPADIAPVEAEAGTQETGAPVETEAADLDRVPSPIEAGEAAPSVVRKADQVAREPRAAKSVPEGVEKARKAPAKTAKTAGPVGKRVLELEEVADERVGKKKRPLPGKKVVEYTPRRKRDYTADLDADRDPTRRRFEVRREKRGPKRAAMKPSLTVPKPIKRKIRMAGEITVGELAKRLSVKAAEIIKKLMQNQIVANINQSIDFDTASLIAQDYEYEVENTVQEESQLLPEELDRPEGKVLRPPVVTIMGHVNHGKTRLLDTIRKTNVMEKEAGGITQHIGAHKVNVGEKTIVFLDTPGHEAFTKMRARGAQVTDIVVLVVAGDDGVMPQTVEAIDHAQAAQVPIIVAINKIDLPNANPDKVKQGLSEHGLISEEWGGDTLFASISAKEGMGIQELLEIILLQAEMQELKSDPNREAKGLIIEARLDRTLGTVSAVLVQDGTLRAGDPFVTGLYHGKVRALIDDRGSRVEEAGPSTPVEVLGCSGVPEAGDPFFVVADEKKAKALSAMRMEKSRQAGAAAQAKMSLEDLYEKIRQDEIEELNLILKADVQGSTEALAESLERLSNEEVRIKVLHSGVGGVTETDVMLASASNALIIGFNVRAESKAMSLAEQEKVDIRFYTVIYDAVSDVEDAILGMLKPVYKEVLLGHAEIRDTFNMQRVGMIAGSYIVDGKMERNARVRLLRDSVVVHDGRIASLRRFKEDVKEVVAGYECGIRMENYNDVKTGDVIESYALEQVAPRAPERSPER